jgi:glycosyltransferase involved in cell wall biosynthesis
MHFLRKTFLSLLFFLTLGLIDANESIASIEKPLVFIVPSYNNKQWYEKNLLSMINQKYRNFRLIYIDDCSPDGTGALVTAFLENAQIPHRRVLFDDRVAKDIPSSTHLFSDLVNEETVFFTLVLNARRNGALANLYRAIHSCKDEEIAVLVDGDDWLFDDEVLKKLNETYASKEIWFTHGTIKEYPWGHVAWSEPFPDSVIAARTFRQFKCPSHMRTFYTWLFKKIRLEDFLYNGDFFAMTWDMAIMYPLAEMAEERHAFISQVNYIYNMANPINDNKVDPQLQNDLDRLIRKKTPYARLQQTEIPSFMQ